MEVLRVREEREERSGSMGNGRNTNEPPVKPNAIATPAVTENPIGIGA